MISQGFSGLEIKFSMAIRANALDALMQLEKCTDYRVGRKKSYYFVLQKGLIQTAKCFHFENVLGVAY